MSFLLSTIKTLAGSNSVPENNVVSVAAAPAPAAAPAINAAEEAHEGKKINNFLSEIFP